MADGHRWAMGRFTHGYDNYIRHAFPHDELKPLSLSHADSLGVHAGCPQQMPPTRQLRLG